MGINILQQWINILFTRFSKNKVAIAEISFYGFYALLVLVKSLGYNSGHFIYKLSFIIGIFFWVIKVFCTRYSLREILWILLFSIIAGGMYLKLGELTGILLLMCIIGVKNCCFHKLVSITLWCRFFSILVLTGTAAIGLQDRQATIIYDQSFAQRYAYAFGFGKHNLFFLSAFLVILTFLYVEYEHINMWYFIGTLVPMVIVFKLTYCRTGFILFFVLWIMIFIDRKLHVRSVYRVYCFSYLIGGIISLTATILYDGQNLFMQKINHIFNGRLEIMSTYYNNVGIVLFPRNIETFSFYLNRIIDNLYMSLIITSGIIIGTVFVILMTRCSLALYKQNMGKELIFMVIFAMYAMLEEFPLNPSMNPFILLLGVLLYKERFCIREKQLNE